MDIPLTPVMRCAWCGGVIIAADYVQAEERFMVLRGDRWVFIWDYIYLHPRCSAIRIYSQRHWRGGA